MLKAEQLIGAGRYERSAERQDTRAGHYERGFGTTELVNDDETLSVNI